MRIRSIKPDFFSDEDLLDLEEANPGKYVMLVFAGLWGNCDKEGVFEWKPRTLKRNILFSLPFDMADTLETLKASGFIRHFCVDGKEYGYVPTFKTHQRINGNEKQSPALYPSPPSDSDKESLKKQPGSIGEATKTTGREGKGREEERKKSQPEELPASQAQPAECGRAGETSNQLAIRTAVREKEAFIRRKWPDVDVALETERMVAKARDMPVLDPVQFVLAWFPRAKPARAVMSAAEVEEHDRRVAADFLGQGVADG